MCMMDSMTKQELDCIVTINETRTLRIAQGSGATPKEVVHLLAEHKRFQKMVERMGKMNMDGLENMDAVSD